MSSSSLHSWLPLVHSTHLPLPSFANCYSTAVVQLPRNDSSAYSSSTRQPSSGQTTQLLVATSAELYAVHHHVSAPPPSAARAQLGGQQQQHARSLPQSRPRSATNLPAHAAAASAALAAASSVCPPSSALEPLPLRGLGDVHHGHAAEIIAVDAFNLGAEGRPIITVAAGLLTSTASSSSSSSSASASNTGGAGGGGGKLHTVPTRFVLNIYGLHCGLTSDLHVIAADCTTFRLSFVPFVLTHSTLLHEEGAVAGSSLGGRFQPPPVDILLSGSDKCVHVYRFNPLTRQYAELPIGSPAHPLNHLAHLPSAVLSLDVASGSPDQRHLRTYMVAGCQDGLVRVATRRIRRKKKREEEEFVHPSGVVESDLTPPSSAPPSHTPPAAPAQTDSSTFDVRYSDFHLDGPVSSANFFSPSTFLGAVFRGAASHAGSSRVSVDQSASGGGGGGGGGGGRSVLQDELNDNKLNRMQRRAFGAVSEERQRRRRELEREEGARNEDDDDNGAEACEDDEEDADAYRDWRSSSRSRSSSAEPSELQGEVRLLLSNAVGFGAVYGSLDPAHVSFAHSWYLNGAGCFSGSRFDELVHPSSDSVLTSSALDLNMDGRTELLLGTYAAQMIVFREDHEGTRAQEFEEEEGALYGHSNRHCSRVDVPLGYSLATIKQFAHPVYSIRQVELGSSSSSSSGVPDLVVTSMYGIDVMSWEVDSARQLLQTKLECIHEIQQLEQALEQMIIMQQQQQQQQQQPHLQQPPPQPKHGSATPTPASMLSSHEQQPAAPPPSGALEQPTTLEL
jgi:hypothetical protein